jgi:hypothetical protein
MMISVYILFFHYRGAAVYLMKLEREIKEEQAVRFNKLALRSLPIVIVALIILR